MKITRFMFFSCNHRLWISKGLFVRETPAFLLEVMTFRNRNHSVLVRLNEQELAHLRSLIHSYLIAEFLVWFWVYRKMILSYGFIPKDACTNADGKVLIDFLRSVRSALLLARSSNQYLNHFS